MSKDIIAKLREEIEASKNLIIVNEEWLKRLEDDYLKGLDVIKDDKNERD